MRVHLGNGRVYLRPSVWDDPENGWLNVDLPNYAGRVLAQERKDLVQQLGTTEDKYYGRVGSGRTIEDFTVGGEADQACICDAYGSFAHIPAGDKSVTEILARQVFEHLSYREAKQALIECDRVLVPGGILKLDVPDHEESMRKYHATGIPFFKRHILGSRKDESAYHVMGYTKGGLIQLCKDYCFDYVEEEDNIHPYPALCLRFQKMGERGASWQWAMREPNGLYHSLDAQVSGGWKVLEIGPGSDPWPRADWYCDCNREFAEKAAAQHGGEISACDVANMPFGDNEFDYCLASHIVEHTIDPVLACKEISRVAKRGCLVLPSVMKDTIMAFHEQGHNWVCLPLGEMGVVRFMSSDVPWVKMVRDVGMQGVAHRLYRLGPGRCDHDSFIARRWFWKAEPWLDIVHHWEGEIKAEVLT